MTCIYEGLHHQALDIALASGDHHRVWLRWPEFGVGLRADPDLGPGQFRVVHWRGPRDPRDFPTHLAYGRLGQWPWLATYRDSP